VKRKFEDADRTDFSATSEGVRSWKCRNSDLIFCDNRFAYDCFTGKPGDPLTNWVKS